MSKTYFAKWLPVEGEIKEGDFSILASGRVLPVNEGRYRMLKRTGRPHVTKVKLFLCSRDIQDNDKVYYQDSNSNEGGSDWSGEATVMYYQNDLKMFMIDLVHTTTGVAEEEIFKIVGEVSPAALSYVKEGDEFDESDIMLGMLGPDEYENESFYPDKAFNWKLEKNHPDIFARYTRGVKVKGPCEHFH